MTMRRFGSDGLTIAALTAAAALAQMGPGVAGVPGITRHLRTGQPRAAREGVIALSFDDGPHPNGTPAILDLLAEFGATATFFVIGEQLIRCPELGRRIVDGNHEIAVHGWTHRCLLARGPLDTMIEMRRARDLIKDVSGVTPTRFRPPYGVASGACLIACARLGLTPTWWTAWGRDWAPDATAQRVADLVDAGVDRTRRRCPTVLLHDADTYGSQGSWRVTADATRRLLTRWQDSGREARSLSGCEPTTVMATKRWGASGVATMEQVVTTARVEPPSGGGEAWTR